MGVQNSYMVCLRMGMGMVAFMGAKRQAASILASQQSRRLHVKYQDWSTFFNSNACLS